MVTQDAPPFENNVCIELYNFHIEQFNAMILQVFNIATLFIETAETCPINCFYACKTLD